MPRAIRLSSKGRTAPSLFLKHTSHSPNLEFSTFPIDPTNQWPGSAMSLASCLMGYCRIGQYSKLLQGSTFEYFPLPHLGLAGVNCLFVSEWTDLVLSESTSLTNLFCIWMDKLSFIREHVSLKGEYWLHWVWERSGRENKVIIDFFPWLCI